MLPVICQHPLTNAAEFSPRRDFGFTDNLCYSPFLAHDDKIKTICGFDLLFSPLLWRSPKEETRCIKLPGQVLLSASVSSILNNKSCLCDFGLGGFLQQRSWGQRWSQWKAPLEESLASRGWRLRWIAADSKDLSYPSRHGSSMSVSSLPCAKSWWGVQSGTEPLNNPSTQPPAVAHHPVQRGVILPCAGALSESTISRDAICHR